MSDESFVPDREFFLTVMIGLKENPRFHDAIAIMGPDSLAGLVVALGFITVAALPVAVVAGAITFLFGGMKRASDREDLESKLGTAFRRYLGIPHYGSKEFIFNRAQTASPTEIKWIFDYIQASGRW